MIASATQHALSSDHVRDQLVARTVDCNGKRYHADGQYVLYWMQTTHRLDDNWALRAAIRTADRINRPLIIHQGLDPTYPYASARHHTFILQGARDTARDAIARGLFYQFVLRRARDDDRRVLDRLASRAYLVFTDLFPTAGVHERTMRFAQRASCRVLAIDSVCTVPSGTFERAEYAARTIRPKIAALLANAIEPVDDVPPQCGVSDAVRAMVHELTQSAVLPIATMTNDDITREVSRCAIDHDVRAVPDVAGGSVAAQSQLARFLQHTLSEYATRRNEASDPFGTSNLSAYLHYGQISSAQIVRDVLAARVSTDSETAFVNQVTTWRELSFNWCLRTPHFDTIEALPAWIQRTMAEHVNDPREWHYDRDTLERGDTHDVLWNAAQRQLVSSGLVHNYPRMLWGKTVLLWTSTYHEALSNLLYLNDKYALDGRDANSVGGIMWCLGLWDRPWGNKPIWGGIRPMVTSRAKMKFDVAAYIAQN